MTYFDNLFICCKDLCPLAKQPLNIPGLRHQLEELLQLQAWGSLQLYRESLYTFLLNEGLSLRGGNYWNLFSANNYKSHDWLLSRVTLLKWRRTKMLLGQGYLIYDCLQHKLHSIGVLGKSTGSATGSVTNAYVSKAKPTLKLYRSPSSLLVLWANQEKLIKRYK